MLLYLFVSCAGTRNGEKDGKKIKSDGAKGLAVVMDTEWRRLIVLNNFKNKVVQCTLSMYRMVFLAINSV
jgi:hypothetical protein